MAVLVRITDFIPNTLIESQEVDDEFNQLVNLLSGVSTNKDTLLKYSHATDPVLRVDQLGAGEILRLLQNGAVKTVFDNSGHLYIGEGVTDATPANGLVSATGGSGTNIAGAHLDLAGGKGTGNAIPGQLAVRYPLIGASGTTLQSLSADRFPVSTSLYTATTSGTAVTNTTTETSLFTGATASAGSTLTIEAGSSRAGALYRMRLYLVLQTTGTPTIRFRLKLGGTMVADSTAITTPNNSNGLAFLDLFIPVNTIGATGAVLAQMEGRLTVATSGAFTPVFFAGAAGSITIDFTANQAIDVTAQWSAAAAGNVVQLLTGSYIDRMR
jgi:hypothetical protein